MEIIGHRGASFDAPENTLAAVNLAWQQGADAVEIDIQFSRDQQIVVIHDDDTVRIGGRPGLVRDQTVAELRRLDAGSWKGPNWVGERYPSLEAVIATIPAGKRLFVEVKCGPECIPAFQKAAANCQPAQLVPIGFSAMTMGLLKRALPELEVALVADLEQDAAGQAIPSASHLREAARAQGLDALDVDGNGPVDAAFVREAKRDGLRLYVWTVDDPARARQLMTAGIDGITTNRPGWLRKELGL